MSDEKEAPSFTVEEVHNQVVTLSEDLSERQLVRKLDIYVLPPLTILYLMSYLDRTNIGNAVIFGLKADLGLVGSQYNTALAIFYACYVVVEPPSNTVLKRSRASVYLTFLMLCTAVVGMCMGFVKNFSQLTAVRALIGITEGGFWPGIMFTVGQWYPRREAAYRASIMFSAAGASGAFGGLLARLLEKMDGVAGREGWRWIFIIEGIATFVVAVAMYFFIQDSPETATFLTEVEKEIVIARLTTDGQCMPTAFKWKYIRDTFTSPLVFLMAITQFGTYIGVVSFTTFAPAIVNAMGFDAGLAQLLTVPPYVLGCISTVLVGYLSDRSQTRYPYVIGSTTIALLGYLVLRFTANVPAQVSQPSRSASSQLTFQYVACCLVCIGCLPLVPLEIAWNGNNQGGTLKRAVAIALQVGASNSGGIVGSYAFIATESPRYYTGHAVCAGFMGITILFASLSALYIVYQNRKRDRLYGPAADILPTMTPAEIDEEKERGDHARWWRYTL
ncbi:major facilitator superfamily transporter [Naematelia encephala]|uniref:Major facilitator superfamily transporter n=1 Tax=Naematelia encephala TaxID=71784 RepID=A0A1Y2API9_9TREE|nr:major facilitator superfamily transporter [Naematelia encephala]